MTVALVEMVRTGRVRPPTLTGPLLVPPGPVRTDVEAGALLQAIRDDER